MTPNATLDAMVSFTQYNTGPYEGKWVVVGRRGQVRPRLGSSPRHGGIPWTVRAVDRSIEHGTVKDVSIGVPWRPSSQSLTQEEIARVLELAREQVGEFTVID